MIDFTALTVVDCAVVFLLIVSAIFSTLRGMTREFLGLLGWVVAVVVANYTRPLLEDPIADVINADGLSAALAFGLPFAATVIIWFLLASLLSPGLTRAGLGSLDRWLGVIFGLARGYLLVLLAFSGAVLAIEGENNLPATIQNAQSTPLLSQSAQYFAKFMPDDYNDKLSSNLIDHTRDDATAVETFEKMIDDGAAIVKTPLELLNDEKSN
ncbi:MAG: CvpA family protein [Pseudomonadota bacterium]|nr:CvpA family protein [Pseudomonadota bacterium]